MDNSYFNWKQKQQEVDLGPFNPPENVPPFIRTKETGDKVYFVKEGYAHWITSPEVLTALGGDFGKIEVIDKSIFRQLRIADKITMDAIENFKDAKFVEITPEDIKSEEGYQVDKKAAKELAQEFTQYEEVPDDIPSAPKAEPVKGLTSIIIPAYWLHY